MKQRLAFALIMGMITTCLISFTLIAINMGFTNRFMIAWGKSWAISYVLAVSSILIIGPKIQELIGRCIREV